MPGGEWRARFASEPAHPSATPVRQLPPVRRSARYFAVTSASATSPTIWKLSAEILSIVSPWVW